MTTNKTVNDSERHLTTEEAARKELAEIDQIEARIRESNRYSDRSYNDQVLPDEVRARRRKALEVIAKTAKSEVVVSSIPYKQTLDCSLKRIREHFGNHHE